MKEFVIIISLFVFLFPNCSYSQDEGPCGINTSKKAVKLFEEALDKMQSNKDEAYELILKAIQKDEYFPEALCLAAEINLKKGETLKKAADNNQIHEMLSCFTRAEMNFKKIREICPSYRGFIASYYLGNYYYTNETDYSKAKPLLYEYVKNNNESSQFFADASKKLKHCEEYEYLMSHPVDFDPVPIEGICSTSDEYLPMISPDGSLAFFTHRYARLNKVMNSENFIEEFKVSDRIGETKSGNEKFGAGNAMPLPFNDGSNKNQGAATISIDNNHMFITICEPVAIRGQRYTNCDIFSSDFVNGKWTPLKNLGPNVNGNDTWESQPSLSADGKTLYFASIRKSNTGFTEDNPTCDIWKSVLGPDGKWSKAVNLGKTINTEGNEKSPFMHTDSQTLYYSSDGIPGLGGYDIYYSKQKQDNTWTQPKNIGYPINTEGDDLGFFVSTDGKKAYFASNRCKGEGGWDVFSFNLYQEARPEKVVFIKGDLKDEAGTGLKDAKIELKNTKTNKVHEGMVDKISGKYAIAITVDDDKKDEFLMVVKKDGYAFTSEYIKPYEDEKKYEKPVTVDFEVKPIKVGETVKLNNIQFSTASTKFDEASRIVLSNFVEFLESNPKVKIEIHGHTDNEGIEKKNLILSENRAKAVFDFLLISGIDGGRMAYKGFGQSKPIASNDTPEGRAKNRRTEFVITAK